MNDKHRPGRQIDDDGFPGGGVRRQEPDAESPQQSADDVPAFEQSDGDAGDSGNRHQSDNGFGIGEALAKGLGRAEEGRGRPDHQIPVENRHNDERDDVVLAQRRERAFEGERAEQNEECAGHDPVEDGDRVEALEQVFHLTLLRGAGPPGADSAEKFRERTEHDRRFGAAEPDRFVDRSAFACGPVKNHTTLREFQAPHNRSRAAGTVPLSPPVYRIHTSESQISNANSA